MSLLSVLFDNLQGLAVCEYSYEYQEYNTLDELHHLCGKAHHRQTTVPEEVTEPTLITLINAANPVIAPASV